MVFAAFVRVAGSEQQLMPHQSFEEPLSEQMAHRRPLRSKPALFLDFTSRLHLHSSRTGKTSHAGWGHVLPHHITCHLDFMRTGY